MSKQVHQIELFDSPLTTAVKGETSLMEYPFFDLSKNGRAQGMHFNDGKVKIDIKAANGSVATIYDKDVLIYLASIMVGKINNGETPSQTFTFTAHDYFRVTNRNRSARSYERIASAIERLQGTQIKTNIETGGEGVTGFFSWLEKAEINYTVDRSGKKVMRSITVRVCDFIYRTVLMDRRFLTYHPAYFDLSPLERRVYEIARKHCGRQEGFKISLDKLHKKTGSDASLKSFKRSLYDLIEADNVPEYMIGIVGDDRSALTKSLKADGIVPRNKITATKDQMVVIMPRGAKRTARLCAIT